MQQKEKYVLIALYVAGLFAVLRGIAYYPMATIPDKLPYGLELIEGFISINVWGTLWLIAGILIIASAYFRKYSRIAWGTTVGLMTGWGVAYLLGYFFNAWNGVMTRDWITATSYILPALIIGLLTKYDGDIDNSSEEKIGGR